MNRISEFKAFQNSIVENDISSFLELAFENAEEAIKLNYQPTQYLLHNLILATITLYYQRGQVEEALEFMYTHKLRTRFNTYSQIEQWFDIYYGIGDALLRSHDNLDIYISSLQLKFNHPAYENTSHSRYSRLVLAAIFLVEAMANQNYGDSAIVQTLDRLLLQILNHALRNDGIPLKIEDLIKHPDFAFLAKDILDNRKAVIVHCVDLVSVSTPDSLIACLRKAASSLSILQANEPVSEIKTREPATCENLLPLNTSESITKETQAANSSKLSAQLENFGGFNVSRDASRKRDIRGSKKPSSNLQEDSADKENIAIDSNLPVPPSKTPKLS